MLSRSRLTCGGFAFFLILFGRVLPAPASTLASFNGQTYVPLAQWASANGFEGFTRNQGREFILTRNDSRLVFDVDSAQMEINGIHVRLSFPVACQKNLPYVSELDINTLIRPLINPSAATAKRVTTICLYRVMGARIRETAWAPVFLFIMKKPIRWNWLRYCVNNWKSSVSTSS